MPVKILHGADFHMDSPFDALPDDKAARRREEQRGLLSRLADICADEKTDVVLLAGDLFDSAVSYYETAETLWSVFSDIKARIFISPGNHDYYSDSSPYSCFSFPENVHIFRSPVPEYVDIPALGCRVWGAAFTSMRSKPLLEGFSAGDSGLINMMVLHGDMSGDMYNHISENDVAASGLDYLALGHVHAFSGIRRAGRTFYAYPGCPEGRGFDETGAKGVIAGEVGKSGCSLEFRPLGGREYCIINTDLTGAADVAGAVLRAIPAGSERNICRMILTGEYDGQIDTEEIERLLQSKFFHAVVRNGTRPSRDIWEGIGEDNLRGVFLTMMKARFDTADDSRRRLINAAVRYGTAALDGREAPQL